MTALEGFFIGLLVLTTLAIAWTAGLVVYRLFRSQG
ncbi:hypothetical protein CPER28S_01506 [Cellulomonas persica]